MCFQLIVYMLALLSGLAPPGVLCCPGSPGVGPAYAQPKLTESFSVSACVTATHHALLRVRSFWKSRSDGTFLLVRSQRTLTTVLVGNAYCAPTLNAFSSAMSSGL